jgi:hypothetical protein
MNLKITATTPAYTTGGISEARKGSRSLNDKVNLHSKMERSRNHTRHHNVPWRMRKESRSATTTATTLTNGSHGFIVGESEHDRAGTSHNAYMANDECL